MHINIYILLKTAASLWALRCFIQITSAATVTMLFLSDSAIPGKAEPVVTRKTNFEK